MKTKHVKHLIIDEAKRIIEIYDHDNMKSGPNDKVIDDAFLSFDENRVLTITGKLRIWKHTFTKLYLEDMEEKPMQHYVKQGHKGTFDWFSGKLKDYVQSWYRLERKEEYIATMNVWTFIYK
jgi:hypothetical protein